MPCRLARLLVAMTLVVLPVATRAQVQDPAKPPEAGAAPAQPESVPFADWLGEFRKDALARGISQRTLDAALTGLEPLPVVKERDRTQPERTQSIDLYLKRRLDRKTIKAARDMASQHAAVLAKVSAEFGVPGSIIVAVWGLESNFGRFSGVRPTIQALATLAHDNRRSVMFRDELIAALKILDSGDIDLDKMKGSWAGAMGQPQFMPSSYLKYAADFDKDGRRDIWGNDGDVFASIANYLKQSGWAAGKGWGRAVVVPKASAAKIEAAAPLRTLGCEATRQMTGGLSLAKWRALGVRAAAGAPLPKTDTAASLVRAGSRSFLVFDNYSALLDYNCAHAYALAVGLLADSIPAK